MNPTEKPNLLSPVFLVGCARSGTSILGEVLDSHPRVKYLFEVNPIWKRLFGDRKDDRLAVMAAEGREAIQQLQSEVSDIIVGEPPGTILVDKNPKHTLRIAFLDQAFPACRVIHIIRDGRDTIASLMFRNRAREWGHLKIPGWADLLSQYPEKNHCRSAHQWRDSVRIAREESKLLLPDRYLEVRFEDLVLNSQAAVENVLNFVGLEMTDEVKQATTKIQDETAGSYHAKRQVRHFVDNHTRRVGRYNENLSAEQLREIMEICGDLMEELGYDV